MSTVEALAPASPPAAAMASGPPAAAGPPPPAPAADGDPEEGDAEEAPASTPALGPFGDYQLAQVQRTDVLDGPPRVAVENNGPLPASGGASLRVFADNSLGPATTLALLFDASSASHRVERAVPLAAGERRTVELPLLAGMHYGVVTASAPGVAPKAATIFLHTGARSVVLCLGTAPAFERLAGHPPSYEEAPVQVLALAPAEAPATLQGYSGYAAVALPDPAVLGQLEEPARRALEAYVATGGTLALGGAPRSWSALPLAVPVSGRQPYGFGAVVVLEPGAQGGPEVLRGPVPVTPHASGLRRGSGRHREAEALLPQARPPLGAFLAIIAIFALAIGPGSALVARRLKPAALLLTIPATAAVTSALLVGYSLVADGFTLHGASHGLTLLDGPRHRAITLGVGAYYANLAPVRATYPALTALVTGGAEQGADLTWGDGLELGPDFIPSRVYREWGFLSVEPTRARLVVARRGDGWVVQNALGQRIRWVVVQAPEVLLHAGEVPDGAERPLVRGDGGHRAAPPAEGRFAGAAMEPLLRSLAPGEFLALVEGPGFLPTGGLSPQLDASGHLVRGEVER